MLFLSLPTDVLRTVLLHLYAPEPLACTCKALRDAASGGIKKLRSRKDHARHLVIGCGTSTELLGWFLADLGFRTSAHVCKAIAEIGHLEMLRCARQHGCPWDGATCAKAADKGNFGMLQWARAPLPLGRGDLRVRCASGPS